MKTPKWDALAVEVEEEVQRISGEVCRHISRLMAEGGISTNEMAEILGTHNSYVSAVRNDSRRGRSMSFRSATKFLRLLGYELEVGVRPISRGPTSSPEPSSSPEESASPSSPSAEEPEES